MKDYFLLSLFIVFISCVQSPTIITPVESEDPRSLRSYAQEQDVYIGTSLSYPAFSHPTDPYVEQYKALAAREFNMITPESSLKMEQVWTAVDQYDFSGIDILADFAVENEMKMRGHTLLWYRSVPDWLLEGYSNGTYSNEDVEQLVETYISVVIEHFCTDYPKLIVAWDVVNEAIGPNDPREPNPSDPPFGLRPIDPADPEHLDFWRLTLGDSYPAKAFQWARESLDLQGESSAKLFYNDYNHEYSNDKQKEIQRFLQEELLDKNVPVDGVGLQCHFSIDYLEQVYPGINFSIESISDIIDIYISMGLEVQITEVDVRINDDKQGASVEKYTLQSRLFADLLNASLVKPGVSAFVSWGFTDRVTWYDESYTVNELDSSTDEWPLYFDENLEPKPAYTSIQKALKEWCQ